MKKKIETGKHGGSGKLTYDKYLAQDDGKKSKDIISHNKS